MAVKYVNPEFSTAICGYLWVIGRVIERPAGYNKAPFESVSRHILWPTLTERGIKLIEHVAPPGPRDKLTGHFCALTALTTCHVFFGTQLCQARSITECRVQLLTGCFRQGKSQCLALNQSDAHSCWTRPHLLVLVLVLVLVVVVVVVVVVVQTSRGEIDPKLSQICKLHG